MKHSWKILENKSNGLVEQCKTCDCIRYAYGKNAYTYSRSGLALATEPDCIDWELENNKTID